MVEVVLHRHHHDMLLQVEMCLYSYHGNNTIQTWSHALTEAVCVNCVRLAGMIYKPFGGWNILVPIIGCLARQPPA